MPEATLTRMKLTPFEKHSFMAREPAERAFKPGTADAIVGRKRIGEMTADEYLKLAAEVQRAVAEKAASPRR